MLIPLELPFQSCIFLLHQKLLLACTSKKDSLIVSYHKEVLATMVSCTRLYFATILCFKVRGSSLFKGLIFFPYLISGIAIGFIFKFFYTRGFVLDTVLSWIGLNPESLPYWLKDTRINNASLAATSVWRYMGPVSYTHLTLPTIA